MKLAENMRIMTQNLMHGGGARIQLLVDYVLSKDPDILVLTEFKDESQSGKFVKEELDKKNYNFAFSRDGKNNGVLLASKSQFIVEGDESRKVQVYVPELDIKVFGVYVPDKPGPDKDRYWEEVLRYAEDNKQNRALIVGDFNSCLPSDSENGTKYNAEDIGSLLHIGFADAWEKHHANDNRYTWWSNHGTGFRLDYLFLSESLDKGVNISHENHTKGKVGDEWLSDHCSIVAEIY